MHLPLCSHPSRVGASVLVIALTLGFVGCATTGTKYTVTVDALTNPTGTNGWSYALDPATSNRLGSDPRYGEVVGRIHVALSQRGMYEAPHPSDADFVISFDYGERAPQSRVNMVTQPVMVQPDPFGTGSSIGSPSIGTSPYPSGNPYSGRGHASTAPQVVMVQTPQIVTTSEKYLYISARENPQAARAQGKPPAEVWRVEAKIDDESVDVHKCIPALVDAVIEYIGYSTSEPLQVVVQLGS